MNTEYGKCTISTFKDLDVWKEAHKLVVMVYINSKEFPKDEVFGLTNQLRRAAVSVTSNIAEGFGRSSYKEKHQFYVMACGSLYEIQNQIQIALDIGYIDTKIYDELYNQTIIVSKILNGLIKKTKTMQDNK